jgi:hypothetical protein
MWHSEICLRRTLNKPESCVSQSLGKAPKREFSVTIHSLTTVKPVYIEPTLDHSFLNYSETRLHRTSLDQHLCSE